MILLFCIKSVWDFGRDWNGTLHCFKENGHLNNINSHSHELRLSFNYYCVSFNFVLSVFGVHSIKGIHLLG